MRKCLRLGKFIEHFKAAALAADSKSMDPVLKYLAVGRQLGYAGYMLMDNLTYLDFAGVRKFDGAKRLQREAYKAWVAGLVCNVAAGLYTLYNMKNESQRNETSADAEKTVQRKTLEKYVVLECGSHCRLADQLDRERTATQLQLVSDLCDLTVPTANLGIMNFDDGIVGLAGTTSSLIGLTATWAKTA